MHNGKVILIRHADFTKPVPGAYYGQTDLDLTPAGEQQARALAPLLARLAPDIGRVYASDLSRARHTAALALPQLTAQPLPALREMSFGAWEGRRYAEIKDEPGFAAFAGGGAAPGGESEADFARRVTQATDALLAQSEGTVALVAHVGPIRHIVAHLLGLEPAQSWRFYVDTASLSIITVADGYAYLSALNVRALG